MEKSLFLNTVDPCLSEPQSSKHLDYLSAECDCSIRVLSSVCIFIRGNDCSIRVVERRSIYTSMGFIYPNNFTYLNTFG